MRTLLLPLLLAACPGLSQAFEQDTHKEMSLASVERSHLGGPDRLADIALRASDDPTQRFPSIAGALLTIDELIQFGAEQEDKGWRPLNHFLDPHYSRPLQLPPWLPLGVPVGEQSPDWIVDGEDQDAGDFSWGTAQGDFAGALGGVTVEERSAHWGRMFQALGHVIHHIQDMAQPQHVRNDAHYINEYLSTHFDGEFRLFFEDRSWFERYTLEQSERWLAHVPKTVAAVAFPRARDYWTNDDSLGVADYTNTNFVSKDTNFRRDRGKLARSLNYPAPIPSGKRTWALTAPELGIQNAGELCDKLLLDPVAQRHGADRCEIDLIEVWVVDRPVLMAGRNERAASFSVFDQYLSEVDDSKGLITLNSLNFDAAYRFLIPKAVTYSAGLINHFFRVRIKVESAVAEGGKVRLRVANASEADNQFGPGTFELYYDAVDGTRKPLPIEEGKALATAQLPVSGTHDLLVSIPQDVDRTIEKPFVLMYRGVAGQEEAVGGVVFDAPDLYRGFTFEMSEIGSQGRRLLYQNDGQWLLHPQGGFLAGEVDWKGWYENGKPTRVLSWHGRRYFEPTLSIEGNRYSIIQQRSPVIYQDGRAFAVAPYGVLGAALQRDAQGVAWLIAVTSGGGVDLVFRRPATRSLSPALVDADPNGWELIGTFANPEYLEPIHRDWLFNGDGTEAQTMRERSGRIAALRPGLTRLMITVIGRATSFEDLGNTPAARHAEWADSGCMTQSVWSRHLETVSGESIVAVDYVDARAVFARVTVESTVQGSEAGTWWGVPEYSTSLTGSTKRRWELSAGSASVTLVDDQLNSTASYRYSDGRYSAATSSEYSYARTRIIAMDLRTGVLLLARAHSKGGSSEHQIDEDWTRTGMSTTWWEYAMDAPGLARATPKVSERQIDQSGAGGDRSSYNDSWAGGCASHGERRAPTSVQSDTEIQVGPETVEMLGIFGGTYEGAGASDRVGNHFVSLTYRDGSGAYHRLHGLTDGDAVSVIGVDAAFRAITPN